MPINSQHLHESPAYFITVHSNEDRAFQDITVKNTITSTHQKKSIFLQKKQIAATEHYTATYPQHQSKNKCRPLLGKTLSKKLFQGAKIVPNSKKLTLPYSQKETEKDSPKESQQKKIRFLRVPKQPIKSGLSLQKPKSVAYQQEIASECCIYPQLNSAHQKDIHRNILKKCLTEKNLKINQQEVQVIRENNMFTSQAGQDLLKELIGMQAHSNLKNVCQNLKNSNESQQENSFRKFVLNIPKVESLEINDADEIKKLYGNIIEQTSFSDGIRAQKKGEPQMSILSNLIMKDDYAHFYHAPAKDQYINNSMSTQEFDGLSIMSKN